MNPKQKRHYECYNSQQNRKFLKLFIIEKRLILSFQKVLLCVDPKLNFTTEYPSVLGVLKKNTNHKISADAVSCLYLSR